MDHVQSKLIFEKKTEYKKTFENKNKTNKRTKKKRKARMMKSGIRNDKIYFLIYA
jgi:hypothetical protein